MPSKIDYKLKSEVLKTDLPYRIKQIDKKFKTEMSYDDYTAYDCLLLEFGGLFIDEARKINNASYQRIKRLRERIASYLIRGRCIFATFTFTDEVLQKTNEITRRKYVSRFCKSVSDYYIANIDYGVDDRYTHREHYHALLLTDFVNDKWDYGYSWFERVVTDTSAEKALARYISKLTNHAIKESTRRHALIYSKNIIK